MNLFQNLNNQLFNIPGWRSKRKIVVFESDDWGSIRMPSRKIFNDLLLKGVPVDRYHYDRFDSLESEEDLIQLFDVLQGVHDAHGNPSIFTFNTLMANPDFEAITENEYERYLYEPFNRTYHKYWGKDLMQIWKKGMANKLIAPQFHGREHLNVSLWMQALQLNIKNVKTSFDAGYLGYTGMTQSTNHPHFLSALHVMSDDDIKNKESILEDGLNMFENVFGHRAKTMIACNYVWPQVLEGKMSETGIKAIQGQRAQLNPVTNKNGKISIKRHYTGQKNNFNQYYLVRNCMFEPSSSESKDWVGSCLAEIENAFFWGKPAIISSHRVNYVGSLSASNRERNLNLLKQLLLGIKGRWPNSEFLSSSDLYEAISLSQ